MDHTGAGAKVVTTGELGVAKALTLQGDPNDTAALVVSPLETPTGAAGVVFNNLSFTDPNGLSIDGGHQNITIEDSTLSLLQMTIGKGNANDTIAGNTFTGGVIVNGDGAGLTADHILNNRFIGSGSLYMINNGDSVVSGNTFNVSQNGDPFVAITLVNCPSILVYNNTVNISNADGQTTALLLWDTSFYRQSLTPYVENNVLNTAGQGVGLETSGAVGALVQGNDFRNNAVGVYLSGDGNTAGNVDLGGGSFGSVGQNNFSSFTAAGVASGHFAISMHNTSANDQVFAYGNIWSSVVPPNVVKDSYANSHANEAVLAGSTPGTGEILTVDIQMIPWFRFSNFERLALELASPVFGPLHATDTAASITPAALDAVFANAMA
jgi:hypothetical protein